MQQITNVLIACLFGGSQLCMAAHADELQDRFNTVWESLWTQSGSPTWVIRWSNGVRVRFSGTGVERYRTHVFSVLQAVTKAAGISLRDVSEDENSAKIANLEFRLVGQYELPETIACQTTVHPGRQLQLESALIKARPNLAWDCIFHEAMHAMGIRGHPSGKTVLSYFPHGTGALQPMDVLMLKAWYSPQMRLGATPFEALQVMTDAVVDATIKENEREEAKSAQALFLRNVVQDMERYAEGDGEVPIIVKRSGWASEQAMASGRKQMAYSVGVAYMKGIGRATDLRKAMQWMERSGLKKDAPPKIMLDRIERESEK